MGALSRSQNLLNSAVPEASLLGLSVRIANTTSPPGPRSVVRRQLTSLPLAIPAWMKWSAASQKFTVPASHVIPSVEALAPKFHAVEQLLNAPLVWRESQEQTPLWL